LQSTTISFSNIEKQKNLEKSKKGTTRKNNRSRIENANFYQRKIRATSVIQKWSSQLGKQKNDWWETWRKT
jgi:hypothetical protein